jgi:hypothetical protein
MLVWSSREVNAVSDRRGDRSVQELVRVNCYGLHVRWFLGFVFLPCILLSSLEGTLEPSICSFDTPCC